MNDKIISTIYDSLDEKKGIDIKVIDISSISIISDYFIIAGGNNDKQVQAMADEVYDMLAKDNIHPSHIEGYKNAKWVLMDYGNVVVHIFNQDDRAFYDLERIWSDGSYVSINQ